MAIPPAPTSVQSLIESIPALDGKWMYQLMNFGHFVPWSDVVEWNKLRVGEQLAREHMAKAIEEGFKVSGTLNAINVGRLALDRMLIELLDTDPSLARLGTPGQLFSLATKPNAGTWLVRAGVDLKQVLHMGMKHSAHLHMLFPDFSKNMVVGQAWETWLDQDPSVRGALEALRQQRPDGLPSVETVVFGLQAKQSWARELAQTPHGAQALQQELEYDQVHSVLKHIHLGQAADWVLTQPAWRAWRTAKGDSLLDLTWQVANHFAIKRKTPKLKNRQLKKLAMCAPRLLTEPNSAGKRLIEHLEMDERTRSEIWRVLLTPSTPSASSKPNTPRM